jgi:hypothetical protein
MAAELVQVMQDIDWDLVDLDGLKAVMKNVLSVFRRRLQRMGRAPTA